MIDYEKAYKEALERAKEIKSKILSSHLSTESCKAVSEYIDTIIPELCESEDEKIRKFLIDYFTSYKIGNVATKLNGYRIDDILAYLEKQKINTEGDFGRGYDCGYEACLNSHGAEWLEKQKEPLTPEEKMNHPLYLEGFDVGKRVGETLKAQEPAEWDELQADFRNINEAFEDGKKEVIAHPEKYDLCKPAEWSEEDEDMLNSCISSIEEAKENRYAFKETDGDTSYDHEIAWLKSLRPQGSKDSLQTHWKPSEEQMKALLKAVDKARELHYTSIDGYPGYNDLRSLYEQLKKLM